MIRVGAGLVHARYGSLGTLGKKNLPRINADDTNLNKGFDEDLISLSF